MGFLEARNLSFAYPGGARVLADLTARFDRGKVNHIQGGNGSGKSTLLQILAGLLPASSGWVGFSGEDYVSQPWSALRRSVAFLPQAPAVFCELSVGEHLAAALIGDKVTAQSFGRDRVALGAEAQRRSLSLMAHFGDPLDISRPAELLSVGNKRLLNLIQVLLLKREVLLLDEPFAALDSFRTERLVSLIQRQAESGHTIVIAEHNLPTSLRIDGTTLMVGVSQ